MGNISQSHDLVRRTGVDPIPMTGHQMLTVPRQWLDPIAQYEEVMRSLGRPKSTRYIRTYHLRRFAADHPKIGPWEVTEDHLVAWMAAHNWAPETRRSYRASLRVFYSWAYAKGRISSDPSYGLPGVTPPPAKPRPAPDPVVDAGLRAVDLRARVAIMIFAMTGMRRHEVAKMHTRDLEWVGDGWAVRCIGKGGRERLIPVDDSFAAAIKALPAGYIFPGQIDGHMSANHLGKITAAALPGKWTAHNLRHRFASLAYSIEKDIRATQELLGHAKITTTQIYTYVPQASMRRAAAGARIGLHAA